MRVLVLMGGTSPERDVSLSSGAAVTAALLQAGHIVAAVDTAVGFENGDTDIGAAFLSEDPGVADPMGIPSVPPNPEMLAAMEEALHGRVFAPGVLEACRLADIVFLALHGGAGEDGRTQAALELAGIPHTGADYLGCALAFNKEVSKHLMRQAEIETPAWRMVRSDGMAMGAADDGLLGGSLGYPRIVKPAKGGSTIGISLVEDAGALRSAVEATLRYGSDVLVEEYVDGREFTVGVLGDHALPVVEIGTSDHLFDYEAKYQPGAALETCPARIPMELSDELKRLALLVHASLRLSSLAYSRVDFRVTSEGKPYCLEANALPGMTPNSLLPLAASVAGLDFPRLCERIVALALGRTMLDDGLI